MYLYRFLALAAALFFLTIAGRTQAVVTEIRRVSISSDGVEGNGLSQGASISANGRFVVFSSEASNLVPNDTNSRTDTFIYDFATGLTELVSISTTGEQGNAYQYSTIHPMSDNGRYVLFRSLARNLVPGDTSNSYKLFLRDRQLGQTTLVSPSNLGQTPNTHIGGGQLSNDDRFILFSSYASNIVSGDTNSASDIFLYDRVLDETTLLSVSSAGVIGSGSSQSPQISTDNRILTFDSSDSNLVEGDTNGVSDVFVRNLETGITKRINLTYTGGQPLWGAYGQVISPNGRYVAYSSPSDEIVPNDTNGFTDVFLYDVQTEQTKRITLSSSGEEANSEFSAVSSMSADGRYIVFGSYASNLVPDDTNDTSDVFVHDQQTGETIRISVSATGEQGNDYSGGGQITPDGGYIVFVSSASNLVENDTNNVQDVFVVPFLPPAPPPTPDPSEPDIAPQPNYHASLPLTLSWNDVTWAVEYGIEISESSDFSTPVIFSTTAPAGKLEVVVDFLDAKQYYWRIRAKNNDGVWGAWSAVESITVGS